MKLKNIYKLKGHIKCETGLAIKGMNNELSIGGADAEVIKNPITGEPYIPGSSLKGKMRSQLEKKYGAINNKGYEEVVKPCGCGKNSCVVCTVFGAHMNPNAQSSPTRIIVRDSGLSSKSIKMINIMPIEQGNYMETKAENTVSRNGTLKNTTPRFIERVPAGMEFDLEIVLQVFEGDDFEKMKKAIEEGLKLVELSYLGGSGSRGYGQVSFDYEWIKEV